MKYDEHGVPYLKPEDIEGLVDAFLYERARFCLERPRNTPIATIVNEMREAKELSLVIDIDLGASRNGIKYRGRYHITTKTIFIDSELTNDENRYKFTLAHELGHHLLHRNIDPEILGKKTDESITDTDEELYCNQPVRRSPRTWIEWQANRFAAAVLVPQDTFRRAVVDKQKEMGLRIQNIVYIDDQAVNRIDYSRLIIYLQDLFRVSKTVLEIRLKELGIMRDERKQSQFTREGPIRFQLQFETEDKECE